ncbi:hypothetical protein [Blastomonas sp. UPD001]|uniref:hypothetical protein n=1 Tax=Blastomonas sp. UPD001 TaxID=2217673 RepID=UPI000E342894|nr:hypothetical protein [Blastomonas sp. UPD001]
MVRNCQLSGTITTNLVIPRRAGTVYSLSGRVQVGIDVGPTASTGTAAVLTVEPGVTFFGSSGADFLLVNRGSQLFAEGTADRPIIFTARDNITGVATANSKGLWGGVVILGRAPLSDCATGSPTNPGGTRTDCSGVVEGTNANYGGAVPGDNSGRIAFFQVRYSGFEVQPGNELNGITLAGVGSGTFFQNVQVYNSSDDGIEWFGGRVNGRNLVGLGNDDDTFDMDLGYQGFNQFLLGIQTASANHVIEGDSNGNEQAEPRTKWSMSNATFVSTQTTADEAAILLRGGMDFSAFNSVITGPGWCLDVDSAVTMQASGAAGDESGPPRFESVFLSCPNAFTDDGNVTVASIQALFTAGSNNTTNGTSTLSGIFINGANEIARPVFAVGTINPFYTAVTYIGAVRDAADTRFQGWTCGLYSSTPACTAVPSIPTT